MREAKTFVVGQRHLKMIDQCSQIGWRQSGSFQRVQAKVIEARLQMNGIRRCDPDRRSVARLSPHPQCGQPFLRIRKAHDAYDLGKQFLPCRLNLNIRLREPGTQRFVLQAATRYWRQYNHRSRFVI